MNKCIYIYINTYNVYTYIYSQTYTHSHTHIHVYIWNANTHMYAFVTHTMGQASWHMHSRPTPWHINATPMPYTCAMPVGHDSFKRYGRYTMHTPRRMQGIYPWHRTYVTTLSGMHCCDSLLWLIHMCGMAHGSRHFLTCHLCDDTSVIMYKLEAWSKQRGYHSKQQSKQQGLQSKQKAWQIQQGSNARGRAASGGSLASEPPRAPLSFSQSHTDSRQISFFSPKFQVGPANSAKFLYFPPKFQVEPA